MQDGVEVTISYGTTKLKPHQRSWPSAPFANRLAFIRSTFSSDAMFHNHWIFGYPESTEILGSSSHHDYVRRLNRHLTSFCPSSPPQRGPPPATPVPSGQATLCTGSQSVAQSDATVLTRNAKKTHPILDRTMYCLLSCANIPQTQQRGLKSSAWIVCNCTSTGQNTDLRCRQTICSWRAMSSPNVSHSAESRTKTVRQLDPLDLLHLQAHLQSCLRR